MYRHNFYLYSDKFPTVETRCKFQQFAQQNYGCPFLENARWTGPFFKVTTQIFNQIKSYRNIFKWKCFKNYFNMMNFQQLTLYHVLLINKNFIKYFFNFLKFILSLTLLCTCMLSTFLLIPNKLFTSWYAKQNNNGKKRIFSIIRIILKIIDEIYWNSDQEACAQSIYPQHERFISLD